MTYVQHTRNTTTLKAKAIHRAQFTHKDKTDCPLSAFDFILSLI